MVSSLILLDFLNLDFCDMCFAHKELVDHVGGLMPPILKVGHKFLKRNFHNFSLSIFLSHPAIMVDHNLQLHLVLQTESLNIKPLFCNCQNTL